MEEVQVTERTTAYTYNALNQFVTEASLEGNIIYTYDANGNLLEKEGDTENEFLCTGEQYNANTGLYYLRARYMNPSTGTFISMDSYQGNVYDPVSLHKYLYANANPVMYTDPSRYATDKSLAETAVAATIAVMLASSVALHNQAMLNIFSNLRKNMADTVMSLPCTVSVTDWKNVILGFPAHEFDTKWLITIPMALTLWQLFKAVNDVKEADDEVETPGVPEEQDNEVSEQENNEQEEKDISEIIEDAKDTTNNAGVTKNYEKSGGYEQALKDFEKLKLKDVKDIQTKYGPGKVGTLKNGGKVVARPGSKTGGATLEIKISNKKVYKIRY